MKRTCYLIALIFFLLSEGACAENASETLILATDEFPPYSFFKNGRLSGISVDLVNALVERTGYKGETSLLPWKRALMYANDRPVVLFPFARTPYRENKFKWIGPIMIDSFVFGVRSDDKTAFTGIDDFKKVRVGTKRGMPMALRLNDLGFENIQMVSSDLFNAKKLILGKRIDAWYSSHLIMQYTLKLAGIDPNHLRTAYKDMDVEIYIGASLQVSDQTVSLWQKHLDEMKENGQYQKILYDSILGWDHP